MTSTEAIVAKPTIEELERLLENEEDVPVEILPNGEIRAKGATSNSELQGKKPITMKEQLGGEYDGQVVNVAGVRWTH